MIKKIILKFGSKGLSEKFSIEPDSVTIFVGPNNSGKSLILREIEQYCLTGRKGGQKIIEDLEFIIPSGATIQKEVEDMTIPFKPGEQRTPDHVRYGRFNSTRGFVQHVRKISDLISWSRSAAEFRHFIEHYVAIFVSRFGGKERFSLVDNKGFSDLKSHPKSSLSGIFQNDKKRGEVRALIHEAFGKYFVIDPTSMSQLEIRLSDKEPLTTEIERGWTDSSVEFHSAAKPISTFSDGVQAFTGLVMTIIAGEERIMLIDEPEAFLHPSLANLLGKKISTLMDQRSGNLIVSTHSPFFVMGCLQAGKQLNIVRLTYESFSSPTARLLSSKDVIEMFKNPLLRSAGVIQALFHSSVVVGEGDADRAFYNEINERLLAQEKSEGLTNALFLNAQNKQTVWDIINPLRSMGIPAIGIVDIDVVKEGGEVFSKALKSARVPHTLHKNFQSMRAELKFALDATGKDMKRDGGIKLLSGANHSLAVKFIDDLEEYGIFVVKEGEVESWLKYLNCTGHGPKWLIEIFGKMGSDPDAAGYIKPTKSDVWDFIRSIESWVNNPARKGMFEE